MNLIDVWNAKTFDSELSARLTPSSELIRNNIVTENRIFLECDRVRGGHELVMRPNDLPMPVGSSRCGRSWASGCGSVLSGLGITPV